MKTFSIISLHSFVDVITNSSSELFVCNTKKSVEAVKEVLIELAKLYNQKAQYIESEWHKSPVHIESIFTSVFSEPTASKWEFSIYNFPRCSEWFSMFEDNTPHYGMSYREKTMHPVFAECSEAMKVWNDANPSPEYPSDKHKGKVKTKMEIAYTIHMQKRNKAEAEIFAPWHKMDLEIRGALYKWAAELNGVDLSSLGELKICGGSYSNVFFDKMCYDNRTLEIENSDAARFVSAIDDALSWGYDFKKGDVFLRSARDNSIPFGFWPDIENAFNSVTRIHCG